MSKIFVTGAQNIDIFARSENDLITGDSNPAKIDLSFGGVGRNIAVNMKRLGHEVHFLTAFGDDEFSRSAQNSLNDLGILTGESLFLKKSNGGIYLGIMDKNNDLHLGLNDMHIFQKLKPEFFESKLDYINNFDLIVIDNNLSEESIVYLLNKLKDKTIAMDAVSAHKARKLKNHIDKISILKLNQLELNVLSGLTSSKEQLKDLHSRGALKILLTQQENESIVSCENQILSLKPGAIDKITNATGAGDAFLSGYLHGLLGDKTEEVKLKMANFAAGITLASDESTSPRLSNDILEKAINE